MLELRIVAVGKARNGKFAELIKDYSKRIKWPVTIHEIEAKSKNPQSQQQEEAEKIMSLLTPDMRVIALDQKGREKTSETFADEISKLQDNGQKKLTFIIGGSDGLTNEVRDRADFLLSFGRQTWPHMLARVMLLEQIYRAQQILAGHPYHK